MQKFNPLRWLFVDAGPPHAPGTKYRVAFGIELWGDLNVYVYKVQIVYDGEVSERLIPSFPEGSDDVLRIGNALAELQAGGGKTE